MSFSYQLARLQNAANHRQRGRPEDVCCVYRRDLRDLLKYFHENDKLIRQWKTEQLLESP